MDRQSSRTFQRLILRGNLASINRRLRKSQIFDEPTRGGVIKLLEPVNQPRRGGPLRSICCTLRLIRRIFKIEERPWRPPSTAHLLRFCLASTPARQPPRCLCSPQASAPGPPAASLCRSVGRSCCDAIGRAITTRGCPPDLARLACRAWVYEAVVPDSSAASCN